MSTTNTNTNTNTTEITKLEQENLVLRTLIAQAFLHLSPNTRRVYSARVEEFLIFLRQEKYVFDYSAVQIYLGRLYSSGRMSTACQASQALKKFSLAAHEAGLLTEVEYTGVIKAKVSQVKGRRTGRWLTAEQCVHLLSMPDLHTSRGVRDHALLSMLIGCGQRRAELSSVKVSDIGFREGRPVLVDIVGKGQKIRSIPIPMWVYESVERWLSALRRQQTHADPRRPLFYSMDRTGRINNHLSQSGVWWIVKGYATDAGFGDLAPHDLRRTFAKLAREGGADIEQIQESLGHSSIRTTQVYLGTAQDLRLGHAAGDKINLNPGPRPLK